MGRRRRSGKPINGWVILDKPVDMTSTAAVGAVRRIFDAQKAGHAGTLDPLATGVLPIALGEATKTLPYVVDTDKRYQFLLRWGVATSTDDREGDIIETCERRPSEAEIREMEEAQMLAAAQSNQSNEEQQFEDELDDVDW